MWHVSSRIWRNLDSRMEIDRNRKFEKLLKLDGGQNIFIFGGEGGACPMRGVNFLGGGPYPSAYYE